MAKLSSLIMLILTSLITFPMIAAAEGLSMANYGEVLVENLQIGQTYSMTKLVNLPLEINNKSDKSIIIEMSVIKPSKEILKNGFQAIPDTDWVNIGPKEAPIAARGTYQTDVVLSIPDRPEYMNKKFQVDINARMKPPKTSSLMAVTLAVQGRILFTTANVKQVNPAVTTNVNLGFTIEPALITMKDVPLGKKIPLKAPEQKPIKIKSSTEQKLPIILSSLDPSSTVITLDPGYEACPNPEFVTFPKEEVTLGAKASRVLNAFVELPNDPQYRGKNYIFIVSAQTGAADTGKRYLRVLVSTVK